MKPTAVMPKASPGRRTLARIPVGQPLTWPIPEGIEPKVFMARVYSTATAVSRATGRWYVTRRVGNSVQVGRVV